MPDDLTEDPDYPEVTKLFGGAVSLGRALRSSFPIRRKATIDWQYYGHQAFPWCPDCGVIVAGLGGSIRGKKKLSRGQRQHEVYHAWMDQLAGQLDDWTQLTEHIAELLGITIERGDDGAEQGDSAGLTGGSGGPDRAED